MQSLSFKKNMDSMCRSTATRADFCQQQYAVDNVDTANLCCFVQEEAYQLNWYKYDE